MSYVLDHIFLLVNEGAPEADAIARLGFLEGSPNSHPGMGTANRRFFFDHAMLELLYVRDPAEAQSEPIKPAGIWERSRYRETGASPFAIIIRRGEEGEPIPFETWAWTPPFLPAGVALMAGKTASLEEPFVFVNRVGPRAHPFPDDKPEPIEHPAGPRRITNARITYRQSAPPSEPLQVIQQLGLATFQHGTEPLLELTLDGGQGNTTHDLRPTLPVILRW